jgi:hypothetical protein
MARKKSAEELEDEEGGATMDYGEEPDFSDPEDFVDNITDEVSSPLKLIKPLLWIRVRKIRMFLGLLNPDPLVRGTDPDPSFIKKNSKKNLESYCFVTL